MACSYSAEISPSVSLPSRRAACRPVIWSCSKACCTCCWMRARWRRNAPSAASRETGAPSSASAASAAERAETEASGGFGWVTGVSICMIGTSSRPRRELPASISGDTMRPAPRAGSSGPVPGRRAPRPADRSRGGGVWLRAAGAAANNGNAVSGAPGRPSGPPCFSSDASSEAARRTTGAGTPASSATCTPQERPAAPAATSCRNTTVPFHSFTRMVCGFSRGSRSASSASSWKCVAKMVRQRIAECSASSTAQAIARPSSVAVPRPISSTTTSERGPAWCRMAAVSVISTMKVERPRARSSAAPTRENSRSTTPIVALSAGTGRPAWASTTISAFWRRNVDLPAMFGPVSSSTRWSGERSQSFGTNCAWPASAASTTGWRPAWTRNASSSVTCGRHHVPASASFAADWTASSNGECIGAGGERIGLGQCRLHQVGEHRAFARGGAFAGFGDAAVEVGEFGRGEAGAVGHALAQGEFREVAQLLHRGGRRLDDVAELGVVADLQAGDAVALRIVELQGGEHAAAVVAQRAFGVEFGVEARDGWRCRRPAGAAPGRPARRSGSVPAMEST